jgi:hypothetical protein
MGLLLAVPLTALVKLVADLRPSLGPLSNMLALTPRPIPRWLRYGETIVERTIPYLRGGSGNETRSDQELAIRAMPPIATLLLPLGEVYLTKLTEPSADDPVTTIANICLHCC